MAAMTRLGKSRDAMKQAALFYALSEDGINRLLRLHPESLQRLGDLDGKVVCLCYRPSTAAEVLWRWYLFPSEAGIGVRQSHEGAADVTITGNLIAFARMLGSSSAPQASADMQIQGDIELGQQFQRIFKGFEVDWEELSSQYIGDIGARQLGNLARRLRAWRRQAHQDLVQNIGEYLLEEVTMTPFADEIESFMQDVDRLRGDVARIEQRIQMLLVNTA